MLGVKSFEEIMREKQQKRAAVVNTSNKKLEKSATSETESTSAVTKSTASVQHAPKTKQAAAAPRKYKFTPIVFDLNSKGNGQVNSGRNIKQSKRENLEVRADSGDSSILGRRRVSVSKAADEASADSAVAVTDISTTAQSSVPSKSDVTAAATIVSTGNAVDRITPVIKRQSSSTPLSDGSKKRRTSADSR